MRSAENVKIAVWWDEINGLCVSHISNINLWEGSIPTEDWLLLQKVGLETDVFYDK